MNESSRFAVTCEESLNEAKDSKKKDLQINTKELSDAPTKPTWKSFFNYKNLASEDFMSVRDLKLEKV